MIKKALTLIDSYILVNLGVSSDKISHPRSSFGIGHGSSCWRGHIWVPRKLKRKPNWVKTKFPRSPPWESEISSIRQKSRRKLQANLELSAYMVFGLLRYFNNTLVFFFYLLGSVCLLYEYVFYVLNVRVQSSINLPPCSCWTWTCRRHGRFGTC